VALVPSIQATESLSTFVAKSSAVFYHSSTMGLSESQLDILRNVMLASNIFESRSTPVSASTSGLLSQGPATVPPANDLIKGEMQFGIVPFAVSAATKSSHAEEDTIIAFVVEGTNTMQTATIRHVSAADVAVISGSGPVAEKSDLFVVCSEAVSTVMEAALVGEEPTAQILLCQKFTWLLKFCLLMAIRPDSI
jgi:hypothetical protein